MKKDMLINKITKKRRYLISIEVAIVIIVFFTWLLTLVLLGGGLFEVSGDITKSKATRVILTYLFAILYTVIYFSKTSQLIDIIKIKYLNSNVSEDDFNQLVQIHNIDPEHIKRFKAKFDRRDAVKKYIEVCNEESEYDEYIYDIKNIKNKLDDEQYREVYNAKDVIELVKTSEIVNLIKPPTYH